MHPVVRAGGRLVALLSLTTLVGCRGEEPAPTEPSLAVTAASGALAFRQISVGMAHTCGVTTDNRGYCWGLNRNGELGIGTREDAPRLRPVAVKGTLRFLEIRAGASFTCGLSTDNRVYCWGINSSGQLGTGRTVARRLVPTEIAGGRRYRLVRTGSAHACANTTANVTYCWGSNFQGQLGDGTTENRLAPVRSKRAGQTFTRLSLGASYSCAVTTEDQAYCWGSNVVGQLGVGHTFRRATPTRVLGGLTWKQVSAGFGHTCGVASDNRAYCWGSNTHGGLGDGTAGIGADRLTPTAVTGDLRFSGVDPGDGYTCGITTNDRAFCWGTNAQGQLGLGGVVLEDQQQITPAPVVGGRQFDVVLTGRATTCGLTGAGAAYCWGDPVIGDGSNERRLAPTAVAGP